MLSYFILVAKPIFVFIEFRCIHIFSSWHDSAVLSDTKFLIHGGYNGNNALSDTFIFDTGERQLTMLLLSACNFLKYFLSSHAQAKVMSLSQIFHLL